MFKRQINVEDLQLGMWVVELDRPWLGTPFDFQGFPVTSDEQLADVRRFCKFVFVDPERAGPIVHARRAPSAPRSTEPTQVAEELVVAREVYDECEKAVSAALADLKIEAKLDLDRLAAATADITASIQRNPHAVVLLHRLHKKSTYELRRAMDSSITMIAFGRALEFTKERLELLGLAGMLLDVGKVKIPDALLNKTGILTPDEYQLMKGHVMHSVELVRDTKGQLPPGIADIILQHHERQDGTGYPQGLKGHEISMEGAIAAIVDSFSALTSERCFAEPMAPSAALNHLHELRGQTFNEGLVEKFVQCIGVYPVGSAVELNTGEIGIVMTQNDLRRLQPSVMLVLDRERKQLPHPQLIIDLAKEPKTKSGEPYRIRAALPIQQLPINTEDLSLAWLSGDASPSSAAPQSVNGTPTS